MSYIYNLADTWDNAGTVFTAIKMDVTDVASNASSALLDLQVGGVSKFKVNKNGATTVTNNTTSVVPASGTMFFLYGADNTQTRFTCDTYSSDAGAGTTQTMRRARGTAATPAAVQNGDALGQFVVFGYGATTFGSAAGAVRIRAGETFTDTSRKTAITFDTTNTGESNASARMVIEGDGGMYMAGAAGGSQGANTINASALYDDGVAIPTISSSDTLSNKTLSSPTVSGTVAGSATWSGAQTFGVGGASGTATYLYINGTAAGTGGGSALWINNNGTIKGGIGSWSAFSGGAYDSDLTLYSPTGTYYCSEAGIKRQIATDANVMTLSNKTLSSPTLSGTIAGAATWSGTQTFGVGTGAPVIRIDGGSSTNNGAIIDGRAAGVTQWAVGSYSGIIGGAYDPDFTIYNATNSGKAYIYDAGNKLQIVTTTASETLSNKTLSSPTLSGTVAGTSTFSGATTFQDYNLVIQTTSATGTSGLRFRQSDGVQRWDWGFNDNDDSIFLNRFNSSGSYQDTPILVDSTGAVTFKGVAVPTISSSDTLSNKTLSGVTMADGTNIVLNTTTGTKIGTGTSQKLGFFNATPVVQPTAVADATDAASAITQLNALLSRMRDLGLIAT